MLLKLMSSWASRNLLRNRQRSLLTVAGIAAAATCVILMQGFADYSYQGLSERFARSGNGHIQIGNESSFDSPVPEKYRIDKNKLDAVRAAIKRESSLDGEVSSISLRRNFSGLVGTARGSEVFQGHAVEFQAYSPMATAQKILVPVGMMNIGEFDVVLGKVLAERLQVKVGDSISLLVSTDGGRTNAMDFTVAGTIETGSTQLDAVYLLASIKAVLPLLDTVDVDVLMVGLKDTAKTDAVSSVIKKIILPISFNEKSERNSGKDTLGIRNWDQLADYYRSVKNLYERILGTIKIILGIISILAVSNSMLLIIHERKGEVAMLRAIGMHSSQVISIFTLEGIFLGGIGGLLGVAGALFFSVIVSAMGGIPMPPPPGSSEGYSLKFLLTFVGCIKVCILFIFCTAFASFLASRKAVKLHIPSGLMASLLLFISMLGVLQLGYIPSANAAINTLKNKNASEVKSINPKDLLDKWEKLRGVTESTMVVETKFENLGDHDEVTNSVTYRVAVTDDYVLAVSISDKLGERMAILSSTDGMWMQKEKMRKPMRVSPSQRLLGQASNGDVVSVKLAKDYVPSEFLNGILVLRAQDKSQSAAYGRIDLIWNETQSLVTGAKLYAISGKLLKTVSYSFNTEGSVTKLKSAIIQDAISSSLKTRVIFGTVSKSEFSANFFNPELMLSSMQTLIKWVPQN